MTEHSNRPNNTGVNLREFFTLWLENIDRFMDERDRRYETRFEGQEKAVAAALAAADKQVTTAFSASEKAVAKAEDAQKDYNQRSNEFRGQLDDQAKTLMPRSEALVRFEAVESRVSALETYRHQNEGKSSGQAPYIAIAFAIVSAVMTAAILHFVFP